MAILNKAARCNRPTLFNSYEMAKKAIEENVAGDFVECGTFCGAQLAAMWRACKDKQKFRTMHFFDSFEGIPQATYADGSDWVGRGGDGSGALVSTGYSSCSLEQCKDYLTKWGVDQKWCKFYPGWFQITLPKNKLGAISVLRLDADLYESTVICLEYMFPKVSPGGYVIIDDYALRGCRRACDEYFKSIKIQPETVKVKGGGGPVWFRKEDK